MNRHNLTQEEQEMLITEAGAYAVIIGYLKAERGKIAPTIFNKIAERLGYPKLKKVQLKEFALELKEDEVLTSLYNKGYDRIIKIDDIPTAGQEIEPFLETDMFSQLTNYLISNEDNNANIRELRKLQRQGIYMELLMKGLKEHLADELKGMPRAKYMKSAKAKPKKGDKNLILLFSDWHIGALVYNEDTGGYNFEKLKGQLQEIIEFILSLIKDLDIKQVYIFHVGDTIEHISMRNVNQAYESEFPATAQIAKGTRLLIDVLKVVSDHVPVTFGMVAGNHDRFEGNKNDKVYNDNATYIMLDTLLMVQENFGALPNVHIIDNREDTYEFSIEIAGKTLKVKHGDYEKKKDDVKIPKHIKEKPVDYLILGHIHTTRIVQEDYARFHLYVGSTMGANNYSKELNLPTTAASQMALVLTEGSDTPYFIPLMLDKKGKLN
ncbi:putative metallophosphatase [Bacillus phage BSP38]|uniref:Putative metallophosphatase n=1 Tax=Bacillus phage BSP38 TaxID=2283013 RepID=A0A345MK07_BPBSP|nr:exonuclease [Bacillus phage BSP38]AXH71189.1 putative metallophosphatase [Bacillus phage BSP38]